MRFWSALNPSNMSSAKVDSCWWERHRRLSVFVALFGKLSKLLIPRRKSISQLITNWFPSTTSGTHRHLKERKKTFICVCYLFFFDVSVQFFIMLQKYSSFYLWPRRSPFGNAFSEHRNNATVFGSFWGSSIGKQSRHIFIKWKKGTKNKLRLRLHFRRAFVLGGSITHFVTYRRRHGCWKVGEMVTPKNLHFCFAIVLKIFPLNLVFRGEDKCKVLYVKYVMLGWSSPFHSKGFYPSNMAFFYPQNPLVTVLFQQKEPQQMFN